MNVAKNLEASAYFFPERPMIKEGSVIVAFVLLSPTYAAFDDS